MIAARTAALPIRERPADIPESPGSSDSAKARSRCGGRRSNSDADLSATEEQVIRNAIKTVVSGPREGRNLAAFRSLLRGRIQASESDLASRLEPWIRKD
jgi:type IV secretory pathway VirB4 component